MKYKKKIILIILFLVLSILLIIPLACWCENEIAICFEEKIINYNIENIVDIYMTCFLNKKIFQIWLVNTFILFLFSFNIIYTIKKAKIEYKGIKFKRNDGTFGTAEWMEKNELTNCLEVGTGNGLILGEIDNQVITLPEETWLNKNVAVFGASRK